VGNNFWINKSSANKHHYLRFTQVKHNLAGNYDKWYASGRKQNTPTSVLVNGLVSASASSNPNMLSVAATPSPTLIGVQAPNWYYCKQSYAWRTVGGLPSTTYSTNNVMLSSSTVNQSTYVPDVTRTGKVRTHTYTPVRLMKNSTASKLKLSYNSASSFAQKPASSNFYFVVKQKRYIPTNFEMNKYSLGEGRHLAKANFNSNDTHLLTQHCASRSALPNLQANRRLLRTRRVLVLPAHTNITLITNSFDVMHSWYIPGLGVKLDCVPGRSTHHTIHIDHAGFYYGQCAEICGRYHHHMPIRVCALPFEHFLI
jgi:heme/copper-type cytochrome/quinol oxidase subunit 2